MTLEELQKEVEDLKSTLAEKKTAFESLKSSNERLLSESTKNKMRAKDAETKLTEVEKNKLAAEGNIKELLEKAQDENTKLANKLSRTKKMTISEKLRAEVAKYAKDAHDVDMVLKVSDHAELLKVDEDEESESISLTGVDEFVKKTRETHGFLFAKGKLLTTEDGKGDSEGKKPMTENEKYLAALDKCETQKDFDNCRKKFGRS